MERRWLSPSRTTRLRHSSLMETLAPLGSRFDSVILQDSLHRLACDLVPKIGEHSADSRVAPFRILHCHPHDKLGDLARRGRSTSTSSDTSVILLRDQFTVPAKNGVWCHIAGDLNQGPTSEPLAPHSESPTSGISQAKRFAAELLAEDLIFFAQIVDQVYLLAVQPPSHGQHEELQSGGHSPRQCGSAPARTSLFPRARLCRPLFRTLRGNEFRRQRSPILAI